MKKTNKVTTKSAKKPVAVKSAAKKPVAKKASVAKVKKVAAPKGEVTVISARVDVGFGNMLTIRGEGPGLSWDTGVLLDCIENDLWAITLPTATKPVVFKVLVNDLHWSAGPDFVVNPGSKDVIAPTF